MRLALVLCLLVLCACSCDDQPEDELLIATLVVSTATGPVDLAVEVADTDEEREVGLMGRQDLGAYDGMVFIWEEPDRRFFTMRDTPIPLSIAFWDEGGRIVRILEMEPCTTDACPTYRSGEPALGAVEVEQGFFADHGIAVGDQVELAEAAT